MVVYQEKVIENYPMYSVGTNGVVFSIQKGEKRILKPYKNYGYNCVSLHNDIGSRKFKVCRLVGIAFIPNPENKRTINHKDGIRDNDFVDNLEWNTYQENHRHAWDVLGRVSAMKGKTDTKHHNSTPVVKLSLTGEYISEYGSIAEASRQNNTSLSAISACCVKKKYVKSIGGFKWMHKSEYDSFKEELSKLTGK